MVTGQENKAQNISGSYLEKRSILSIVFFPEKVQVQELKMGSGEVIRNEQLNWKQEHMSPDNLPQLQSFLHSDFVIEKSVATRVGSEFCLIPSSYYDPAEKDEYRLKNGTKEETALSKVSILSAVDSHLIYGFPHQLDKFLLNQFPGIHILSEVEIAISYLFQHKAYTLALAVFHQNHLLILLKKNGRLLFCNRFTVQTSEDFLYFISYVLKINKCYSTTTPVKVLGNVPAFTDRELCNQYLGALEWPENEEDNHFYIQYSLECAS